MQIVYYTVQSAECGGWGSDTAISKTYVYNTSEVLRLPHKLPFQHVCRHRKLLKGTMPARQNHMTTFLDTFEAFDKQRFWSFPHGHCEARRKPETRDATRWSVKTSISRETSSKFDTLTPSNRNRFCFFHKHGEARGKPKLETRHVGASKRAFRARRPPNFDNLYLQNRHFPSSFSKDLEICHLNIDVSCGASTKIIIQSHKVPRLPRNLHLGTTLRSPDTAIRRTHATRHVGSAAPATRQHVYSLQSTCHKVPRLPRETRLRDAGNIQHVFLSQNLP